MNRLKQLGKDSAVYGIGGIASKSIPFFLLPIYTRVFSPVDYGSIEMLTILGNFIAAILIMGMDSAQSMYFFREKEKGRAAQNSIVSAVFYWRTIWGGATIVFATLLTPLINSLLFDGEIQFLDFFVVFLNVFFLQIMSQSAEVLRLIYRPWGYISVVLSQSVLAAAFVLLFVVVLEQGITGYFLGSAIASFLVAIFGWYKVRDYLEFKNAHFVHWPMLIKFGAPLMPSALAVYVMNTSDRWFVQYYHGSEALGIFSVGAKFALILMLAVQTFREAWWPIAMDSMHSSDGKVTFQLISKLYIGLGTAAIVILTFFSQSLVTFMTASEYHSGWVLVGILAWQAVFYGFFLIASAGIWKAEKTYLNLYIIIFTALIGIGMNLLLVPELGGVGAAIATAITHFLWIIITMVVSERYWRLDLPLLTFGTQILIASSFVWFFLVQGELNFMFFLSALIASGLILALMIKVLGYESFVNALKSR
ncbi:MAG: hypothetical protein CMI56_01510 [Parcubacteria group bacterium]|nr:hypothetical protein [Parcubacteria group bacterium]